MMTPVSILVNHVKMETLLVSLFDSEGDGWNGTTINLINNSTGELFEGITLDDGFSEEFEILLTAGCYDVVSSIDLDPEQVSFVISVNSENGTEDIYGTAGSTQVFSVGGTSGCTDPLALNFNAQATCETGDCFYCVEDGPCEFDDIEGLSAGPCNRLEIFGPGNYTVKGTSYSGHLNPGESIIIPLKQPPNDYDILIKDDGFPMVTKYGGVTKQTGGNGHNNCVYIDIIKCIIIYYNWNKSKTTLSMNNDEGNGWDGLTYQIRDGEYAELYSGTLSAASIGDLEFFGADEFDLPDGCYFLTFESETGIFNESNTFRLDNVDQEFIHGVISESPVLFSVNSGICSTGCTDTNAINYEPDAVVPCSGTNACCIYSPSNTSCLTAEPLFSGELVEWDTKNISLSEVITEETPSLWYSFESDCRDLVSFAGNGLNGFEFCLYEECTTEDMMSPVYCSSNNLDSQNQGAFRLNENQTSYWKIMSSGELNITGDGQLKLESIGCLGCTQEGAINFDETAGLDDGSCMFEEPCVGDLNGDSIVTAQDLTIFLSAFGVECGE